MELKLIRTKESNDATIGSLYNGTEFVCYTLEDERREVKVKGETRIPEGAYEVFFRKESTPMGEKYKKRFPWFTYHLQLKNVPGFEYIYIHIGNTDEDTMGCILVGLKANTTDMTISESVLAYERVYKAIQKELLAGNKVKITITNK